MFDHFEAQFLSGIRVYSSCSGSLALDAFKYFYLSTGGLVVEESGDVEEVFVPFVELSNF